MKNYLAGIIVLFVIYFGVNDEQGLLNNLSKDQPELNGVGLYVHDENQPELNGMGLYAHDENQPELNGMGLYAHDENQPELNGLDLYV